jgi:hypothetical protein
LLRDGVTDIEVFEANQALARVAEAQQRLQDHWLARARQPALMRNSVPGLCLLGAQTFISREDTLSL